MWRRTIDCLGVAVEITSQVAEIEPVLGSVFRTYADAGREPELAYGLEVAARPTLMRDGKALRRVVAAIDLVAVLELDLYRQVMARAQGLIVHAGAVAGGDGRALVFAGRSGAGKSTLVRALLARGFRYVTEECVALETGGSCRGLARSLHVDEDGVAMPAGFETGDYPIRGPNGAVRISRLFLPPERAIWRGDARAVAVVAIDHGYGAESALTPLGGGAALARLWPTVFRSDGAALRDAAVVLADLARYHLHTCHPDEAVERAVALAAELGVEPA